MRKILLESLKNSNLGHNLCLEESQEGQSYA